MTTDSAEIKSILVGRLLNMGMAECNIPGFMRSLANSVFASPTLNHHQIFSHLRYLGWEGFDLDYHTLQLALAVFESDGLYDLDGISKHRF